MRLEETIEIYTDRNDLVERQLRHFGITYKRLNSGLTPLGNRHDYRVFGEPKKLLIAVECIGHELGEMEAKEESHD